MIVFYVIEGWHTSESEWTKGMGAFWSLKGLTSHVNEKDPCTNWNTSLHTPENRQGFQNGRAWGRQIMREQRKGQRHRRGAAHSGVKWISNCIGFIWARSTRELPLPWTSLMLVQRSHAAHLTLQLLHLKRRKSLFLQRECWPQIQNTERDF